MKSKRNRGLGGPCGWFTIIELLLVLVILGLLIGIAVPLFEKTMARANLVNAARQMAADLRMHQQAAINAEDTMNTYLVLFNLDQNTYSLQRNTQIMKTVHLPGSVQIINSNFPGQSNRLRFNIQGKPFDGGGRITLQDNISGKLYYVIVAAISGRVRISDQPPDGGELAG